MLHPNCLLAQMCKPKPKQLLYLFFINTVFISGPATVGRSNQKEEFIFFLKEKLNQVWKKNRILLLVKLISFWTSKMMETHLNVLMLNFEQLLYFYFNQTLYHKNLLLKWGLMQKYEKKVLFCTMMGSFVKKYLLLLLLVKKWA